MIACYLGKQHTSTIIEINLKHLREEDITFLETNIGKIGNKTEIGPIVYTVDTLKALDDESVSEYKNLYSICSAASLQEIDIIWFNQRAYRLEHVSWYGEPGAFE